MNKRLLLDLGKYALAAGLLFWVVRANWSPAPAPRAVAAVAASTVAVAPSPLVAAAALFPGRGQPTGLGHVWERHAVQGQPIRWGFFLAALFTYGAALFLTLVRWYRLVRALDLPLSFRDAMRYGLVGIFFNTFLPGSVGGDIIKATVLARGQKRRTAAVATVVMDRAIALWALVWFVAMLGSVCWLAGMLTGGVASFIVTTAAIIAGTTGLGWLMLGLLVAGAAGFGLLRRNPAFRERSDAALLTLPLAGKLARGYNAARFSGTLAMLAGAGVPILKALQAAAETLGNRAMRADAMEALVQVREGAPLASAMATKKRFPGLLSMFARLGEQTGQLPVMLQRAATQLGAEVQRRAMALATILEPLLIVVMGVVVMLIVLAVLLPIIQLNTFVK